MKLTSPIFDSIFLLLLLAWLPNIATSTETKCPLLKATGATESEKTGCYIVVLNKATTAENFTNILDKVLEMSEDAKVYGSVQKIAKAFTVKLSEIAVEAVSCIHIYSRDYICMLKESERVREGESPKSMGKADVKLGRFSSTTCTESGGTVITHVCMLFSSTALILASAEYLETLLLNFYYRFALFLR